jgi:hypothetical protein
MNQLRKNAPKSGSRHAPVVARAGVEHARWALTILVQKLVDPPRLKLFFRSPFSSEIPQKVF